MNDTAKLEDTAVEDSADYARQACLAGADAAHAGPGGFASSEREAMDAAFRLACQRVRRLRRWYVHALIYACVIGGLWLIYALSPNGARFAWPLPATLGWGLGLSVHGLVVWLGSSLQGRRWEARKIEQYMSEAVRARAGGALVTGRALESGREAGHDAGHAAAYQEARRRVRVLRGFYRHLTIYAVVNAGLMIINLLTPTGRLWFLWPMGGWGLGLLVHGFSIWSNSSFLGREWEERKIAQLLAREKIRVLSTEKQLAEAQLRLLQAQIEPHFLFNTLANVVSLIETAPARATEMLEHFIAYLRASLAASRSTRGTVAQEAALLRNYLELLKIRMGARLAYTIEVEPGLEQAPFAPMLLQPVVENALRHGLEPKIEGGQVDIRIAREGGRMIARVEDDGLGFRPGANQGVGLQNLRDRLAVLYDGDARLVVEERERGTAVVLDLPLQA